MAGLKRFSAMVRATRQPLDLDAGGQTLGALGAPQHREVKSDGPCPVRGNPGLLMQ